MIRSPHGVTQPLCIPVYQCKAQHQKVPENSPGPALGRVAVRDGGRGEKSEWFCSTVNWLAVFTRLTELLQSLVEIDMFD